MESLEREKEAEANNGARSEDEQEGYSALNLANLHRM